MMALGPRPANLGSRPATHDPLLARLRINSDISLEPTEDSVQRSPDDDISVHSVHSAPASLDWSKDAKEWMLDPANWSGVFRRHRRMVEACWEVIDNRQLHRQRVLEYQKNLSISEQTGVEDECDWDVEDLVTGPAVCYAWLSNIITWLGFLLVSVLAAFFTGVNAQTGIADSLFGWDWGFFGTLGVWLVTTLLPLYCEFIAALHVLPAQATAFGRPDVFGGLSKGRRTFRSSLCVLLFISFLQRTDIFTAAMFVGRVFKSTHSCNGSIREWSLGWLWKGDLHSPLEQIWKQSTRKHAICPEHTVICHHTMNVVTFWQFTLISWMMMLLQLVYAIFRAMPVSPDLRNEPDFQNECFTSCGKWRRKYKLVRDVHTYQDAGEVKKFPRRRSLYHTLAATLTSHGRCLQALGDSGRMMSIQWLDDDYCLEASKEWDLQKIVEQMQRANWRFFLFAIQAIMGSYLQVFFYGSQKYLWNSAAGLSAMFVDGFTTLSVWISVLFGIKYIVWEMKILHRAWTRLEQAIKRDVDRWRNTQNTLHKWEVITFRRHGYCSIFLGLVISLIAGILLIHLVSKVFMQMMWCSSGIWEMEGCIPIHIHSSGWTGNWSTSMCETGFEKWADIR